MTPEGKIKKQIKDYLDSLGSDCKYFMPQSGVYGNSGTSDIIACVYGQFVAIETKADKTKKPTALQYKFLEDVTKACGYSFVVCDDASLTELKNEFESIRYNYS